MQLFDYQGVMRRDIDQGYDEGARVIMPVLPTGGGKTVVVGDDLANTDGPTCSIAHRQELVGQISIAMARYGLPHSILAPRKTVREIQALHSDELGTSRYIKPNSHNIVAGVDTLIARKDEYKNWCPTVKKVVIDEGHHVLRCNKWGRAFDLFPNARGLFPTATPIRADRRGLGAHADGYVDRLIEGPTMAELIALGRLVPYRIICTKEMALDASQLAVSQSTGDYNEKQMRDMSRKYKGKIAGDVVKAYLQHAKGMLGVTFTADTETATHVAREFNKQGVRAEVVTAKTPARQRADILRRFRRREIMQLVNVDLFGEGFDLPVLEVVSFARPTKSYSLYCQQFGRVLRTAEGKQFGLVIDHVGNIVEHGLPDKARIWSLDSGHSKPRGYGDDIGLRSCGECAMPFERDLWACPYCGAGYEPAERSGPELVDGDLVELDEETLKLLRGEVAKTDRHPDAVSQMLLKSGSTQVVAFSAAKNQRIKQEVQSNLRTAMGWWSTYHKTLGRDDRQIQKRFYLVFGIDTLSAQALGKREAAELTRRIADQLGRLHLERLGNGAR